jgi:transcriptional regulator with XRE-family HTH domain
MGTRSATDEIVRANLVRFREEAGLKQESAAAAVGLTRDGLLRMEAGTRGLPKPALLKALSDLYGHSVDHFYMESPPAPDLSRSPVLVPIALVAVSEEVMDQARAALASLNEVLRRHVVRQSPASIPPPNIPMPLGTVRPDQPKRRSSRDRVKAPLTIPPGDDIHESRPHDDDNPDE